MTADERAAAIKEVKTAAAMATLSTLPPVARKALAASAALLADYDARLRELERVVNGGK